jgi:hypothetical protein
MTHSASATVEGVGVEHDTGHGHKSCRNGKKRWSGLEIVTMVGGFIVFWPLGLLALGTKLIRGEMWPGASHGAPPWAAYKDWKQTHRPEGFGFANSQWQRRWNHRATSGNEAFDTYRKQQLERLEAERRKLEDEQRLFAEHLAKLRRAKDQEEFDRFMAERNAAPGPV